MMGCKSDNVEGNWEETCWVSMEKILVLSVGYEILVID